MPYLKEQVEIINTILKSEGLNESRFSTGLIVGLAEVAIVEDSEERRTYPYRKDDNGNFVEITINDTYPFIIYHRHEDSDFQTLPGFGSNNDREIESQQMVLIAYGREEALGLDKEQLASFINLAMPNNISSSLLAGIKIDSMNVSRQGYDVNSLRVFGEEYSGVDFKIAPGSFLLKIRYTIEAGYRKDCFNLCDCE